MHRLMAVWGELFNDIYNHLCAHNGFCCAVSLLFFIPESLGKNCVSADVYMPLTGDESVRGRLWAANAFIQDE